MTNNDESTLAIRGKSDGGWVARQNKPHQKKRRHRTKTHELQQSVARFPVFPLLNPLPYLTLTVRTSHRYYYCGFILACHPPPAKV